MSGLGSFIIDPHSDYDVPDMGYSDEELAQIEEQSVEMMQCGGECDPFTYANFEEALTQAQGDKVRERDAILALAHTNPDLAAKQLLGFVRNYWQDVAQYVAKQNL